MLHLPSAAVRGTVPTTAVFTAATGARCVFVSSGPGTGTAAPAASVPITDAAPVNGEIGLASVQADLVGATVVRNPRSLPADVLGGCA